MKNTISIFILALLLGGTLSAQDRVRYTQSAAEIDLVKKVESAYNAGNWDKFVSYYHAEAVANHNGTNFSPKALAAGLGATTEQCSYYSLSMAPAALERIVNDQGEVWVNAWGTWRGVPHGTTDTVRTPVNLTFEIKEGQIVREFAYYDNLIARRAMAKASVGKDRLLLIREDYLKPGAEAAYSAMVASYVKALDDAEVAGLRWVSGRAEDRSMVFHQTPINSLLDLQAKRAEESRGHAALGSQKMEEINAAFLSSVTDRKEFVVRRHAARSYWPTEGFDGTVGYMNMIRMRVAPENYPAFIGLVDEGVKLARDGKTPLPFAFFTYEIGGSMTDGVIIEYGIDAADYATRKEADAKVYGTKEGKAWYAKLEALIQDYGENKITLAPEISRQAKQ